MNIIVCIKQVPDTTEIRFDPETNTMIRAGVPATINPFDKFSLEAAVQLKEKYGGTVTAVTMGPEPAVQSLREAYSLGADQMVLVTDRIFGGSDTYSTGYILSRAIRLLGDFDLIVCGKQATDGDTAQVGPAIAEQLDLPQLTYASQIQIEDGSVIVKRELEDCFELTQAPLPALVTVGKSVIEPRLPNVMRKLKANRMQPMCISSADLPELDTGRIGLTGSPTKVSKTFVPTMKKNTVMLYETKAEETVGQLLAELDSRKIDLAGGFGND